MKKTTIYLSDREVYELRRLQASTGQSQSDLIRQALRTYLEDRLTPRKLRLTASGASARSGESSIAGDEEARLRGETDRDGGWP